MEQSLLDPSKFRIFSLSMDSRFADTNFQSTSDFLIRMPSVYRNITRIAVSSAEIPLVEYLFSERHGNLNFAVSVNGGPWIEGAIPAGNYKDPELMTVLTTELQKIDTRFEATRDVITGKVTILHETKAFRIRLVSNNLTIAARPTHWGLGYQLGFRNKGDIVSTPLIGSPPAQEVVGTSIILVQPTPYYLLQLYAPDNLVNMTHRVSEGGSVAAFAKLILRENKYFIQFMDNADYLRKEYTFLTPVNISQVRVRLLDPYGELVDMFDMDWSFTLELYEVTNARIHTAMSAIYDR
jgi:hypothetical protein